MRNPVPAGFRVVAAGVLLSVVAGLIVSGLNDYQQTFAARVALLIVVTYGLNVLISSAGLLSLAGIAFLGIGAYGVIIVNQRWSLPLIAAIPVVVAISWVIGLLLGLVSVRVAHFYLALTTLGFLTLFQVLLVKGGSVTGAGYGLVAPLPTVFGRMLSPHTITMACVVLAGFGAVLTRALVGSRTGRAWKLMKESSVAAESFGMNLVTLKTSAFASTAAATALAGTLFPFVLGAVSPDSFSQSNSIDSLVYVVVGGVGSVLGSVLGPLVIEGVPELFSGLAQYRDIFSGALVVLILIGAPDGIAGLLRRGARRYLRPLANRATTSATAEHAAEIVRTPIAESSTRTSLREPERVMVARDAIAVEYRDVSVNYGGVRAVAAASLAVRAGSIHGLIGPNGAGKTTMINALTGHSHVTEGEIRLGDSVVRTRSGGLPTRRVANLGVSRTFQTPHVIADLSALDNVTIGLYAWGRSGIVTGALRTRGSRREEREAHERARQALHFVEFDGDPDAPLSSLSFGQIRKVEIARAVVTRPVLLLLDEPTSGLETHVADELLTHLGELQARTTEQPMTVIIVEHNVPLILSHCDEVTAMTDGTVIATDTPDAIRANERIRQSYLGEQIEIDELIVQDGSDEPEGADRARA